MNDRVIKNFKTIDRSNFFYWIERNIANKQQ